MKPKLRLFVIGVLFLFFGLLERCTGPILWGCNPSYLLCCVAVFSMFTGEKSAALFGLVAGLFADFAAPGIFGIRGVLYMLFGYTIVFLAEKILPRNVVTCTIVGMLSVMLGELAVWGVVCLGQAERFENAAKYVFLPRVVLSLPVVLLVYALLSLLYREWEIRPKRRRW